MKRFVTSLLLLIMAAFVLAPAAQATKNYNSSLSDILSEICGGPECKGDIVNGQLILIGKNGKKHAAPDGTYTDDNGKTIQVIDGKALQKTDQSNRRNH